MQGMLVIFYLILFVYGIVIGSFVNVLIYEHYLKQNAAILYQVRIQKFLMDMHEKLRLIDNKALYQK